MVGYRSCSVAAAVAAMALAASAADVPVAERDQQAMMERLDIQALRYGPRCAGWQKPEVCNPSADNAGPFPAANYDEAKANPYGPLPDPLTTAAGRKVTSAAMWRQVRRPELAAAVATEMVGRVPAGVPAVTWTVAGRTEARIDGTAVRITNLIGQVDNAADPAVAVTIRMTLIVPAAAKAPVHTMLMLSWRPYDPAAPSADDTVRLGALTKAGWGAALLIPTSVQPDNGEGLAVGIVGLTARGGRRAPEDWGALRAWAWGASRGLDYLLTDPAVDGRHVAIEGVSRYGKAALVAMAFDERFAAGLIGSSGRGGAGPFRRDFGERLENLTTGEYYWMAGNFLRYGAETAAFGRKTARDLPVDTHDLIALCAPRPVFLSFGVPAGGDPLWIDPAGGFMSAVAADPVYRLLGAPGLSASAMPEPGRGLLAGRLAWRQHLGGHTDTPNLAIFLSWAEAQFDRAPGP